MIGTLGPRPDGLDAPFWEALQHDQLVLQRCQDCRAWIWAPQWCCPECLTLEPGWEAVEPRGRVFTWTRTWQPFTPELADHVPFLTVVVELPHAGGRRLLGLLDGDQDRDPAIGAEVTGVFRDGLLRWTRA